MFRGRAGVLIALSTVSACRTAAFVLRGTTANLSSRRFFVSGPNSMHRMSARDDELRRLREENEQLRQKLENKESDPFDLNKLKDRVSGALSSAFEPFGFGKNKIQKQESSSAEAMVDKMLKDFPFPVRVFGGLIKGVVGMASETMKGAASDIDRIRDLTVRTVSLNSQVIAEFSKDIEIDSPFSQAYSSSSINGKTAKSVALRMPIRGRGSSVIVASRSQESLFHSMRVGRQFPCCAPHPHTTIVSAPHSLSIFAGHRCGGCLH
jgi:hypothetical protein